MVELLNGQDTGPLAGWCIYIAQGKVLLGKPADVGLSVTPVYELVAMMQMVQRTPQERPQLMTMRQCVPLLTFPSLREISAPQGAIVIHVEALSKKERRELLASVEACEQLIAAMRAQDSGLLLMPPGAKLPPLGP
jgi:hypothetical protein